MKKMGGNKGFTLVELIIVIAILAIIMLIAIPNFSGIQQRMKVRADKATAAQIGKAVRVWYTDYTSDPVMKSTIDGTTDKVIPSTTPVEYSTITSIDGYAAKTYKPTSLTKDGVAVTDQVYLVNLSGTANGAKVVVGIGTAANITADSKAGAEADGDNYVGYLDDTANSKTVSVNYAGTAPGVAYVEP